MSIKDEEKFINQDEWLPRLVSTIGLFMCILNIPPVVGVIPCIASFAYIIYKKKVLKDFPYYKRELIFVSVALVISIIISVYSIVSIVNNIGSITSSSTSSSMMS